MLDLRVYLDEKRRWVDNALEMHLPAEDTRPQSLHKAMRYSVFSGGKRLRPILCVATAEALGVPPDRVLLQAIGIEALHTYTLIHDDLPAMDDDALRRGKPTSHIVFGEANAILAGDALLTLAFEWLALTEAPAPFLPAQYVIEMAESAGHRGVIAGQVEDIAAEGAEPTAERIDFIHLHKTATLIRAAVRIGAIAGAADTPSFDALTLYGCNIGIAFQIADDILNATATEETLGKPVGTDRAKKKMTYVALHGVEESRKRARVLVDEAVDALSRVKGQTEVLAAIAHHIVDRSS